jgi:hypothetical protein
MDIPRYEDYTRQQRARLLLKDEEAYKALLGPDQWMLILDGIARSKPHVPEVLPPEEKWRKILRIRSTSR